MRKLLGQYATLLAKLYLDRRRHRGPSEFSFRILRGDRRHHRVRVTARDGGFQRTILLRRHTSDLATFEQVFANNAFNLRRSARWKDISRYYQCIVERGVPLILDAGANIGLASLYFSKNWPRSRIVAVEPEPRNFDAMCVNLATLANILPLHAAIANDDGAVKIVDPGAEAYAMRTEHVAAEMAGAIPALSVASVLRQASDGAIPFIAKIDIEGFERDLFAKNTVWVESFPVIIIELHDWMIPKGGTSRNFLRVISQYDRDFVVMGENVVSITNAPCPPRP